MGKSRRLCNAYDHRINLGQAVGKGVRREKVLANSLYGAFNQQELALLKDETHFLNGSPVIESIVYVGTFGGLAGVEVEAQVNGDRLLALPFIGKDPDDTAEKHPGKLHLIKVLLVTVFDGGKQHRWSL